MHGLFSCVQVVTLFSLEGLVVINEIMDTELLFNCAVDEVSEVQIVDEVVVHCPRARSRPFLLALTMALRAGPPSVGLTPGQGQPWPFDI